MNNSDKNLSVLQIEEELTKSKRLLVQALAEKESLLRGNELARFVPNKGGQVEFFAQALSYLRCVFSGNRFGKSTAGVVEDASWLLGFRPFYPEGHLLRYAGIPEDGVKGVVIASTWEKVEDIFVREGDPSVDDRVGKMFKYLPAANITSTARNQHGVISRINVSSVIKGRVRNSILCFNTVRSFLTNPLGQESSDWDFVHVDEPIPEEMWNAIARGLMDRGGKSWWLMTPLSEPWMFHAASNMEISSPDKCWTYIGDTDENITLSEENKENYFSTLSEDELACRKSGKPIALSRLVVSNFDRNKHVLRGTPIGWSSPLVPPKEFMICIATDTHPQTPHATLKVAVSPRGDIFVYGERFQKGQSRDQIRLRSIF
ncbi:MAG: hypothetical protein HC840_01365 [Leptolyngbyaceae cyanobacterium RM2_2_4]|nr:hypothetical protein [Leptolyngbyaceae cyanobacterium RM2_2_4]